MDRVIEVQRDTREGSAVSPMGTPQPDWRHHKFLRAEVVAQSTGEFLAAGGERGDRVAVFRTHYVRDLTPADRVLFDGVAHDIHEIIEIGRRRGLEIRCRTKGGAAP